jgi:5'-nucleotidase
VRILQEQEAVLRRGLEENFFLNLNVGNLPADSVEGWEWSDVADTRYHDGYVRHEDPSGRPHYWLEGELDLRDPRPFCDVAVVRAHKVSVSPISIEPGAREVLAGLRGAS